MSDGLLDAETNWFHVFRGMFSDGEIAKIGALAFTVYCAIKAHSDFRTGTSFPSIETIALKTGISTRQVKRELETLESNGYLTKEKNGRSNLYKLRERIAIKNSAGVNQAVATWDYLPTALQSAVTDLKRVLVTGDFAGAKIVQIETLNLTVNVNTMHDGTQVNFNAGEIKDDKLRESVQKLMSNNQKRAGEH